MHKFVIFYAAVVMMLAALAIACGSQPAPEAPATGLTEPAPSTPTAAATAEPTTAPTAAAADSSDATAEPAAGAPLVEASTMPDLPNPHTLDAFPESAAYGDYAVGTFTSFAVDNRQRFDPWNTAYASPAYREMLRRVEAAGQTRTVIFQLWYPAVPDTAAGRLDGVRSPYPAADGRRAAHLDFFLRDEALYTSGGGGGFLNPQILYADDGVSLGQAPPDRQAAVNADIARQNMTLPQGAWLDATPADAPDNGKFPVIVIAHGLGGHHSMWGRQAEFLASHGYIVAAPTFISDGTLPMVFHDPASPFSNSATPAEVREAYRVLTGEFKVIPQFYQMMFGVDLSGGFEALARFDPAATQAVPGGAERATTMMQNLFRQRVADVGLVLQTVRLLGDAAGECRTALTAMGAVTVAAERCGLLAGRVDGARVGLSGHSLGAMTALLGVNHLPGVDAALGINNAPPFTWTPEEMYGSGEAADGQPIGSRQPVFIMIGDEDAFVQSIFVTLFQASLAAAGGDPTRAFPLESERAQPERLENPQPVALSSYQRATGDRIFAVVRDTDHSILVDDFARNNPWPAYQRGEIPFAQTPVRLRKATGAAAFELPAPSGEPYYQMDWAEVPGAGEVYLPHLVRDWYTRAWFDWYLKDDQEARSRLQGDGPFGALTYTLREVQ